MIERNIGRVPVEVNIYEANELYFNKEHSEQISEPGIGGIINALYRINQCQHMPLSAFFELTNTCNFSCPFCYINESNTQHHTLPRFPQLKPTLDYLIEKGLLYAVLSGGECLLHPDFPEIFTYLKKSGVLVTIFTNGYLLDEKILTLFSTYKPFKVEISIYGIDDASYSSATGRPNTSANRVFENILKLKASGVTVICKTPITSLTENSYEQIQRWCQKHDILFYSGTELMQTYGGESKTSYLASETVRKRFEAESNAQFFQDPEMMRLAYTEKHQRINFDCSGGKTDIMINSGYELMPCMKAAWIPEWKFSISASGIDSAYTTLVHKILAVKGQPLRYCGGCNHSEICQECYMTQYEHSDLKAHRKDYCQTLKQYLQRP